MDQSKDLSRTAKTPAKPVTTKKTVLRVKRRREDPPLPSHIRLSFCSSPEFSSPCDPEDLNGAVAENVAAKRLKRPSKFAFSETDEALSHLLHSSTYISRRQEQQRENVNNEKHNERNYASLAGKNTTTTEDLTTKHQSVLFRRVESTTFGKAVNTESKGHKKRSCSEVVINPLATETDAITDDIGKNTALASLVTDDENNVDDTDGGTMLRVVECRYASSSRNGKDNRDDDDDECCRHEGDSNEMGVNESSAQRTHQNHHHGKQHYPPNKRPRMTFHVVASNTMNESDLLSSLSSTASQLKKHGTSLGNGKLGTATEESQGCEEMGTPAYSRGTKGGGAGKMSPSSRRQRARSNTAATRSRGTVVLDPMTRVINERLSQCHNGGGGICSSTNCVSQPLMQLLSSSNDLFGRESSVARAKRVLLHTSDSGRGSVLHACALWNDPQGASDVLDHLIRVVDGGGFDGLSINGNVSNKECGYALVEKFCFMRDGDGRTAVEVARMSGSDAVADVIECRLESLPTISRNRFDRNGKDLTKKKQKETSSNGNDGDDNDEYVYDFFYIADGASAKRGEARTTTTTTTRGAGEGNDFYPRTAQVVNGGSDAANDVAGSGEIDENSKENGAEDDDDWTLTVEMKGGFGYWNERGELVLETNAENSDGENSGDGNRWSNQARADELDHDSNDEAYEGNDYPEEDEDEDDEWNVCQGMGIGDDDGYPSSSSSDSSRKTRRMAADATNFGSFLSSHRYGGGNGDYDDDMIYEIPGYRHGAGIFVGGDVGSSNEYHGEMVGVREDNRHAMESSFYAFDPELDCGGDR